MSRGRRLGNLGMLTVSILIVILALLAVDLVLIKVVHVLAGEVDQT